MIKSSSHDSKLFYDISISGSWFWKCSFSGFSLYPKMTLCNGPRNHILFSQVTFFEYFTIRFVFWSILNGIWVIWEWVTINFRKCKKLHIIHLKNGLVLHLSQFSGTFTFMNWLWCSFAPLSLLKMQLKVYRFLYVSATETKTTNVGTLVGLFHRHIKIQKKHRYNINICAISKRSKWRRPADICFKCFHLILAKIYWKKSNFVDNLSLSLVK